MLSKNEKESIIKEFGNDPKNTGSTEVQIAILTKDIASLTNYFKVHKMDKHSKIGLYKKISNRSALLKYLKNKDYGSYINLISKLGIKGIK